MRDSQADAPQLLLKIFPDVLVWSKARWIIHARELLLSNNNSRASKNTFLSDLQVRKQHVGQRLGSTGVLLNTEAMINVCQSVGEIVSCLTTRFCWCLDRFLTGSAGPWWLEQSGIFFRGKLGGRNKCIYWFMYLWLNQLVNLSTTLSLLCIHEAKPIRCFVRSQIGSRISNNGKTRNTLKVPYISSLRLWRNFTLRSLGCSAHSLALPLWASNWATVARAHKPHNLVPHIATTQRSEAKHNFYHSTTSSALLFDTVHECVLVVFVQTVI